MPFYCVKMYEKGVARGSHVADSLNRPAAIRRANKWAAEKGWCPDRWTVYRDATTTNASDYVLRNGRYVVA